MQIEEDASAQQFWNQSAEYEHVRHIVDVDKMIPAFQRSLSEVGKRGQNEQ